MPTFAPLLFRLEDNGAREAEHFVSGLPLLVRVVENIYFFGYSWWQRKNWIGLWCHLQFQPRITAGKKEGWFIRRMPVSLKTLVTATHKPLLSELRKHFCEQLIFFPIQLITAIPVVDIIRWDIERGLWGPGPRGSERMRERDRDIEK